MNSTALILAAGDASGASLFISLLVILGTAALVGAVFKRLHLESIPGYLVGGVLVGPHALGLISDRQGVEQISGLAIILLMFGIGLMLEVTSTQRSMLPILAVGAISTLAFILVTWPVGLLFGASPPVALVIAMAFSMSSTAVLLRVLQQRRELRQMHGRVCIGVSIVQDLLSVMILAVLPPIAAWAGSTAAITDNADSEGLPRWASLLRAAAYGFGGIIAMIGFGRLFLPRILRAVSKVESSAGSSSGELVLLLSAAVAIGSALLTGKLGFSPEMGAFLAGFMLSFTPFRHQLAGQLAPLRDLLMAIFFTSVGLQIDPSVLAQDWVRIGLGLAVLLTLKASLIAFTAWAMGATAPVAALSGVYLAQAGEFSLVILAAADQAGIFGVGTHGPGSVIAVVVLSLIVSPLLVKPGHALAAWAAALPQAPWVRSSALRTHAHEHVHDHAGKSGNAEHADQVSEACGPVILAGFGPVGRNLADHFTALRVPITVIELNPSTVTKQTKLGRTIVYGDVTNAEVLESAGVREAEAVVITVPDEDAMLRAVSAVRRLAPGVFIAARANFLSSAIKAKAAGADHVTVEEMATAAAMEKEITVQLAARLSAKHPRHAHPAPEPALSDNPRSIA